MAPGWIAYSRKELEGIGYPFGVWAQHKLDSPWLGELHGPFPTRLDAVDHMATLRQNHEDYDRFTIVRIETPAAPRTKAQT
jgi:hypothetical protein